MLINEEEVYEKEDLWSAMDEYAISEDEMLLIYDDSLMRDQRMFPDTEMGIPTNVTAWGGWNFRSPENVRQLECFGLDPYHFDFSAFLQENVCLVTAVLDPPPEQFERWICNKTGVEDIECTLYGEYNVIYCWQFYQPE